MNNFAKAAGAGAGVAAGAIAHQGAAGGWATRMLRPVVERDIWTLETHGLLEPRACPFPAQDPMLDHPGVGSIGWIWAKGIFTGGFIAWFIAVVGCALLFVDQPPMARLIAGAFWIGPMCWFPGALVGFVIAGLVVVPVKQQKALRSIEWLPYLHVFWRAREDARYRIEQGEVHPHAVAAYFREEWLV